MAIPHHREQLTPRISANELARFMVATDLGREGIIRNARWQGKVRVARYKRARLCLGSFVVDPARNQRILEQGKADLKAILDDPTSSAFKREDAQASIGAINNFQRGWNAFGLGGYNFDRPPAQMPSLDLEGVEVPVTIDAIVRVPDLPNNQNRIGGVLFQMSKGMDGETDAATQKRREIGRNAAVLVYMFADAYLAGRGSAMPDLCYSIDVQHREPHQAPRNYLRRADNMRAACRVIRAMWGTIQPPGDA